MSNFLDFLALNRIFASGTELLTRKILNFTGAGVTVSDDPTNKRTNIAVDGGGGVAIVYFAASSTEPKIPAPPIEGCSLLALECWGTGVELPALPKVVSTTACRGVIATNVGDHALTIKHNVTPADPATYAPIKLRSAADYTLAVGQSIALIYNRSQAYDIGAAATGNPADSAWWAFPIGAI